MRETTSKAVLRVGLCLLGALVFSGSFRGTVAETFVVTRYDDDSGLCTPGDCALREAVIAANVAPGPDRVELPAGLYKLTLIAPDHDNASVTGDLDILDDLEIVGDPIGPTVIQATTDDRVIEILFSNATFSNVEITGGRHVPPLGSSAFGGCVRTILSNVTFVDSAITNCFCPYEGGGLAMQGAAVTFINSTISGNVSETAGGGIYQIGLEPQHSLTLINSTISGNRARFRGGALFRIADGEALISQSTIAQNEALFGSALFLDFPTRRTWVQNSIIEGKCRGISLQSRGSNLGGPDVVDHCFKFGTPRDLAADDLGLGPLADNGGPTLTHALLPGSPAIDAADPDYCEMTDQRSLPRPLGAGCDIGAVELTSTSVLAIPVLDRGGLAVFVLLLMVAAVVVFRHKGGTAPF